MACQISAALELARKADAERTHLREIASLLRAELRARGLPFGSSATHIVPIILGTNENALRVAAHLQTSRYAARAIRPPTVPAGTSRIRISLTCRITAEDVRRIVAIVAESIAAGSESLQAATRSTTMHA
jgi:8-amino-7-oxononanoate synthase